MAQKQTFLHQVACSALPLTPGAGPSWSPLAPCAVTALRALGGERGGWDLVHSVCAPGPGHSGLRADGQTVCVWPPASGSSSDLQKLSRGPGPGLCVGHRLPRRPTLRPWFRGRDAGLSGRLGGGVGEGCRPYGTQFRGGWDEPEARGKGP